MGKNRHARGITPDNGDGDDEHSLAQKRAKIQDHHHLRGHERALMRFVDARARGLLESCCARSQELGNVEVDHPRG